MRYNKVQLLYSAQILDPNDITPSNIAQIKVALFAQIKVALFSQVNANLES